MRLICTALVVCVAGASIAGQANSSTQRVARLAAAGKLWATIKYFHPSISESDPGAWDAALLDAIPRVQSAHTAGEFAAALSQMVAVLGDPITRIERVQPASASRWLGFKSIEDREGVLVVTSGDTGGDPLDSANDVIKRLPQAKGVVFDLRPGVVHPWFWDPRSVIAVVSKPIVYPAHRFRVHAGLVTPRGAEGSPYFSGWMIRAAPVSAPPPPGSRDIPVVFLVRSTEQLPAAAVALQAHGTGYVIAEQPVDDRYIARHGLARHYQMDLTDGLRAHVRTSEMLHADGTVGMRADRLVSASEALGVALAAANGNVSHAQRLPAPAFYQPKRPEQPYAATPYPSEAIRILGAVRIWSVFEWFSAYRHLMDPGWDNVLEEALEKFSAARDAREYHLAVAEMVSHVNDTHSEVTSPVLTDFWGPATPALALRPGEGHAVVVRITDESAARAGISIGDVIVSVDGESTEARLRRISRYIAASTPQALRRDAVNRLLRGADKSIARVRIAKGDGIERDIDLERRVAFRDATMRPAGQEVFRLLPGDIGYIDLRLLRNHEVDQVFDALKDTDGLVFDMRGYPNDTRHAVARKLAAKPITLSGGSLYVRVLFEPGTETRQDLTQARTVIEPSARPYRGRSVMLIDDRAQSQSEATAALLRAVHGTVFIGSATAGANGEGSNFSVPGGLSVGLTAYGVVRADGSSVQRVGERPDIEVLPSVAGIRAGRDEVLERAVAYLTSGSR
jgi:C-terminal processing protease CtpA/Prc